MIFTKIPDISSNRKLLRTYGVMLYRGLIYTCNRTGTTKKKKNPYRSTCSDKEPANCCILLYSLRAYAHPRYVPGFLRILLYLRIYYKHNASIYYYYYYIRNAQNTSRKCGFYLFLFFLDVPNIINKTRRRRQIYIIYINV